MNHQLRIPATWLGLALAMVAVCLGGCLSQDSGSNPLSNLFSKNSEKPFSKKYGRTFSKKRQNTEQYEGLSVAQRADIQLAMARSLERQEDATKTMAAYQDVLRLQPNHPVATHRLAVVHDRHGNYEVSGLLFRRALELSPGNAEVFCDLGYSMYLQDRWSEAEMNLRQAIAINPGNRRAHNNLGLVLAHVGNSNASLAEFRRAGCTATDAHMNLAYVQTLHQNWAEARWHYGVALRADPSSEKAKSRLAKLEMLIAKVDPTSKPGANHTPPASVVKLPPIGAVRKTSATENTPAAGKTPVTGPIAAFVPSLLRWAKVLPKQPAMKLSLRQPAPRVSSRPPAVKVSQPQPTEKVSTPKPAVTVSPPQRSVRFSQPPRTVKLSPARPAVTFDALGPLTKILTSQRFTRNSPSEPVAKLAPTRGALKAVSSEPVTEDSPVGPITKLAPAKSLQKYDLGPQDADAWVSDTAAPRASEPASQTEGSDSSIFSRRDSEIQFRR